jgi:hypothetical protein
MQKILTDFEPRHAQVWGTQTVKLKHALHEMELFSDESLAQLIETIRPERIAINTMAATGHDNRNWKYCDRGSLSGAETLEAVKRGRIWINMNAIHEVDERFAAMLDAMYGELNAHMPDFGSFKHRLGLLISSPGALVYYHLDTPLNILWHLRGRKRVWTYPCDAQHVDPATRLEGAEGTAAATRQLYGALRPTDAWDRDYFPARVRGHDPDALSRLSASGEMIWVGGGRLDETTGTPALTSLRFLRRGTGRAWLPEGEPPLGEPAVRVRDALARHGASFFADLQSATGLGTYPLREALRVRVGAGIATNDSIDALHDVVRWRPVAPVRGNAPDPTRWLPADFVPSRPVVQRRPNLRRLPRWRRPDKEGGERTWSGRWSLVRTPGTLGPETDVDVLAEEIARQWLDRYGVVARDWWRREKPAVGWRSIYHVLKRMEFRGEVQRGYFVRGLAGAQFARPDAVEELRAAAAAAEGTDLPLVVIAASDPANPYNLAPAPGIQPDPLTRPRGRGALLVMRGGRVLLAVEGRGRSVRVRPQLTDEELSAAAAALGEHLTRGSARRRRRDLVVERVDGDVATSGSHVDAFVRAGFRRTARELRFYARPE